VTESSARRADQHLPRSPVTPLRVVHVADGEIPVERGARPTSSRPSPALPRRYLALVFPWLSVERLRLTRPHLLVGRSDAPLALVQGTGGAARLAAVDSQAAQLGLAVGTSLAEARAMVPALNAFAHDCHADLRWLEALAEGCARYSDTVTLDPCDGLVLEIGSRIDGVGGERALAAEVEGRFERRGLLVRHACGDTPAIARALARFPGAPAPDEERAVKRLPVAALDLDAETTTLLVRSGLKTVGDVLALPRGAAATRFGRDAADAIHRLTSPPDPPPATRSAAAPITVERAIPGAITRTGDLLDVLADLAGKAIAELESRDQGGRRWQAWLFVRDGRAQRLVVDMAEPSRDSRALMRMFRDHLHACATLLDPAVGMDLVRLDVTLAERVGAARLRLEDGDGRAGEHSAPIAARRSRGRRPVASDAAADQGELALPAVAPATKTAPGVGLPALAPPIHLFDPPQPIAAMMAEASDDAPSRFRWRGKLHDVARVEGPEPASSTAARVDDTAGSQRDYYRVEDCRGRRFWIFRETRTAPAEPPAWYVHGLFA
jgi:protein ImuB